VYRVKMPAQEEGHDCCAEIFVRYMELTLRSRLHM